jgi:glycine cleavage system transcriptional repressor
VNKFAVSVLGVDRPGIVAAVSRILRDDGCDIEDVSQTILQGQFAAIFIASAPVGLATEFLTGHLETGLRPLGLSVHLKSIQTPLPAPDGERTEPFVVTTRGPDRLGLVAGIAEIMARFAVNITGLKAVFRGGDDPTRNVMIYEVDVPRDIDHQAFRRSLRQRASELGLDLSLQHRDIFQEINRI